MPNFLIVEYGAEHTAILKRLLALRGYESETASSCEEALAKLRRERPDVITINPMLPDRSGFDLCECLKSERVMCLIPVIVITSVHEQAVRNQGFRSGSNAHLTMPYSVDQFFEAVEEALRCPKDHAARFGVGEIVIDTRHEDSRLRQTNDLIVDVLTLTSLPEDEAGELKQIVLEMGDKLRDWGSQRQCELVASIQSKVERDRINLAICRDGLPAGSLDDPLSMSLDTLVERCRFIELPESRSGGRVVLDRIVGKPRTMGLLPFASLQSASPPFV